MAASGGGSRLLAFYGDDLTGSTDAMEALTLAGVPTVLFLDRPDAALLERFADCRAIGLAGTSRSESPAWMDAQLPAVFDWMAGLGAPVVHYKVCSTFDSAPHVGSIGRALEIGQRRFGQGVVPLLVGVPQLRRYTVFGQHFAGFRDEVHRLDRHPVTSCHPVTPMDEADLRRHLARQTGMPVDLIDWQALQREGLDAAVDAVLARGESEPRALLFDVIDQAGLAAIGRQLWRCRRTAPGLLVFGSSGVEYALVAAWQAAGLLSVTRPPPRGDRPPAPQPVDCIAVVSGSCSATTARQIRWAGEHGWALLPIDAARLASGEHGAAELNAVAQRALAALGEGRSVVAHTALGPESVAAGGVSAGGEPHALGRRLGRLLRELVQRAGLQRAVIAGGDTSSHALRELDVQALTTALPLPQSPGSPLCHAHGPACEGLQIALKGGQVGGDDYFETIRLARATAS